MKLGQKIAVGYTRARFRVLSVLSRKKAAEKAFQLFRTPQSRHRRPLPRIFHEATEVHLKLDGLMVRGWRWNHPSEKKILILHGFESSVTNFDRYVRPLVEKGYEVLAFDAPAHGRSGGKTITAPIYKETIKKIHDDFGPVKNFIAHSFGGLAISLTLEEIPHDPSYRVVLIAPATETPTAIDSFFRFLRLDEQVRQEFDKIILRAGGVDAGWYSINRAMQNIKANVLWLHDEGDDTTPLADALPVKEKNYPNLKFVITKGLGHRKIYRDSKVVQTILDFF